MSEALIHFSYVVVLTHFTSVETYIDLPYPPGTYRLVCARADALVIYDYTKDEGLAGPDYSRFPFTFWFNEKKALKWSYFLILMAFEATTSADAKDFKTSFNKLCYSMTTGFNHRLALGIDVWGADNPMYGLVLAGGVLTLCAGTAEKKMVGGESRVHVVSSRNLFALTLILITSISITRR